MRERTAGHGSPEPSVIPSCGVAWKRFIPIAPGPEAGIGTPPPLVQPHLLREGRLVEVMTDWRLKTPDLPLVHVASKHLPKAIRTFKDFVFDAAPGLFPDLPT